MFLLRRGQQFSRAVIRSLPVAPVQSARRVLFVAAASASALSYAVSCESRETASSSPSPSSDEEKAQQEASRVLLERKRRQWKPKSAEEAEAEMQVSGEYQDFFKDSPCEKEFRNFFITHATSATFDESVVVSEELGDKVLRECFERNDTYFKQKLEEKKQQRRKEEEEDEKTYKPQTVEEVEEMINCDHCSIMKMFRESPCKDIHRYVMIEAYSKPTFAEHKECKKAMSPLLHKCIGDNQAWFDSFVEKEEAERLERKKRREEARKKAEEMKNAEEKEESSSTTSDSSSSSAPASS